LEESKEILFSWDFKMNRDSVGASVYQVFEFYYLKKFNINNNLTEWVLS